MNEVINHEKILNELNMKSFKYLREKKLNLKDKNIGGTINQNQLNNKEIDEIINSLENEIKINEKDKNFIINEFVENKLESSIIDNKDIFINTNEKVNVEDNNSYNENINNDIGFKNTFRLIKWLINNNLSCYYDSFYTIFVFNIVNIIKKMKILLVLIITKKKLNMKILNI